VPSNVSFRQFGVRRSSELSKVACEAQSSEDSDERKIVI
jgi:hypothetical protein